MLNKILAILVGFLSLVIVSALFYVMHLLNTIENCKNLQAKLGVPIYISPTIMGKPGKNKIIYLEKPIIIDSSKIDSIYLSDPPRYSEIQIDTIVGTYHIWGIIECPFGQSKLYFDTLFHKSNRSWYISSGFSYDKMFSGDLQIITLRENKGYYIRGSTNKEIGAGFIMKF